MLVIAIPCKLITVTVVISISIIIFIYIVITKKLIFTIIYV